MMVSAFRSCVVAVALSLPSVALVAPVAAVVPVAVTPTPTVMTLSVTPGTVLEGNSVTVTATVRTTTGAAVTTGSVSFAQLAFFEYCQGPQGVPLDAEGRATAQVPIPDGAPYAPDVDAAYVPADATYAPTEASAEIDARWVRLPSELLSVSASHASAADYLVSVDPEAMAHHSCGPEDNLVFGKVDVYEGHSLLGTEYGGTFNSALISVSLTPGVHQVRIHYSATEPLGWGDSSATVNINAAGPATTSTAELVVNPSFESDTAGWTSLNGTVSRRVWAGAPHGSAVAKATRATGTRFTLTDTGAPGTPTVRATTAGATYVGGASVAAATSGSVGKPVALILRERTAAGSLVKETKVQTTLAPAFKQLKVAAKASATGHTIGVRLEQSNAATGHAFFADALTVRHAAEVEGLTDYSLTNGSRGTVWTPLTANVKRASRLEVTRPVDATALFAYLDGKGATTGSQTVRGVIYRDANGAPGALLATTGQVTVRAGAADTFVELPFPATVSVAAGQYWFGLHTGGTTKVARYLATQVQGALRTNLDTYSDGAATTFGASTGHNKGVLIYATGVARIP